MSGAPAAAEGEMIVTIVTPTLNAIEYLPECIESVRRNERPGLKIEHVIADGGSTDGTPELADACGLRVLRRAGKGLVERINEASFDSSGELIGFMGADDLMADGAMEAVVRAWRKDCSRWIVGGVRYIDENGRSLGKLRAPPTFITAGMHVCLGWSPIVQMGTYISRDFFIQLGGFDVAYRASADYEMFARALSHSPYERVARPLASVRRTGTNDGVLSRSRADQENATILARFGPASELERRMYRYALKLGLNLANPEWLVRKMAERARSRLGSQKARYF